MKTRKAINIKKVTLIAALFAGIGAAHAAIQCKCPAGDDTTVVFGDDGTVEIKCSSGASASCSPSEE